MGGKLAFLLKKRAIASGYAYSRPSQEANADPASSLICTAHDPHFPRHDLFIATEFITESQEQKLITICDRLLKRLKYSESHFDSVIRQYRERPIRSWNDSELEACVFDRMRHVMGEWAFPGRTEPIPWLPIHCLDLHELGEIGAHVDHIEVSSVHGC